MSFVAALNLLKQDVGKPPSKLQTLRKVTFMACSSRSLSSTASKASSAVGHAHAPSELQPPDSVHRKDGLLAEHHHGSPTMWLASAVLSWLLGRERLNGTSRSSTKEQHKGRRIAPMARRLNLEVPGRCEEAAELMLNAVGRLMKTKT